MSAHEGLMDELIVITNLLQQHQRQTLVEQLCEPSRDGDRNSLLPRLLRGYLDKVHNAMWLDAAAAHLSRVPAEWVEAACAVTRELAMEPRERIPVPPPNAGSGRIYIPTSPPYTRFVQQEYAAQLQARLNQIIAAILKNDAALLPEDMRQPKSP